MKTFAKSSYVTTFFPSSGSAAASGFITAFVVVVRMAAAESELGKNVVTQELLPKVLMLKHFLKFLVLSHVLYSSFSRIVHDVKRPNTREDSSDCDVFLTKSIALMKSIIKTISAPPGFQNK